MKYFLDANTVIYFFKNQGQVAQRLLSVAPADVVLPSIVLYELEVGLAKSSTPERRRQQLEELVSWLTLQPFGAREAKAAGELRAELERLGTPIGPYDTLIAGTALAHAATLVTHNVRELSRVPGLKLVDWY